jgi:ATP-dependent protease Clp ATPase subunit|tara:strand:- start:4969 stop:5217 length:249 start_codon:yes stop_codon:yes gene_type:complete
MATETNNKLSTVQVCNGCGKNEDEVRKIVFMPNNIAVCNECIELMKSLIETNEDETLSTIDWLRRLGIKTKEIRKIVKTKNF